MLDQTATKRFTDMFGREEGARRRNGFKLQEGELDKKTYGWSRRKAHCERERLVVKSLKQGHR
jgi:hypothetical protein